MKPSGKQYEKEVVVSKVWEQIKGSNCLVTREVSSYIRGLEDILYGLTTTNDLQSERIIELEKQLKK